MSEEHSFGAWIRTRRRSLDLTQEELSEQVGCSPETLRKLEANTRRPSKQLAERLALFLAVQPQDYTRFVVFARASDRHLLQDPEGNGGAVHLPPPLSRVRRASIGVRRPM